MRPSRFLLFVPAFLFLFSAAQKPLTPIWLKSGPIVTGKTFSPNTVDSFNKLTLPVSGFRYGVIQFYAIPTENQKEQLAAAGIYLLDYIPDYAYTFLSSKELEFSFLNKMKAASLVRLTSDQKLHHTLKNGKVVSPTQRSAGTVEVRVSFPKTLNAEEVIGTLEAKGFLVTSTEYQSYNILSIRLPSSRLDELASLAIIEYVEPAPMPEVPLNQSSRNGSRATVLNASVLNGGRGLNGEGIVIGIGDNANPTPHVDFYGRGINRTINPFSGHGTHVAGTIAGGGNINDWYRGFASKSTIITQSFSSIIANAETYVNDYGMVLTNNSYGSSPDCKWFGEYDFSSRVIDEMAFRFPHLLNVFAAGNSGSYTCPPYAQGFHTVLNGLQSSKNGLAVGNTTDSGEVITASSKGPVRDGRLKPEISAMGTMVGSTWPTGTYSLNTGTSMSAPAVTGGLALLYQRYRQLNGGLNPASGLMKALICNGTTDRGNAGPDFSYGFGYMNLLRSVDMLEKSAYVTSSVGHNVLNSHSITVPANTAQLKVMLYWHDPVPSVLASKSLVNDLDLEVASPSAASRLPHVLDTAAAALNTVSFQGVDRLNNIEQVTIENPGAGNYQLKVKGSSVGQNPSQEYFLVYDMIPVSLQLTYPVGGVGHFLNETIRISWDAYGLSSNFTLQYSVDNGASWIDIDNNVHSERRMYTWQVPAVATSGARVRISQNGGSLVSSSQPFIITGPLNISLAPVQCEGYISLNWLPVTGATDYEVMILKHDEMKTVAVTTGTTYAIAGLSPDSIYWVTMRPRINGVPGRRAIALSRQPSSGSCAGTLSDNDLKLSSIVSPRSGRVATSTALTAAHPIIVQVKNLDDVSATGFELKYSVNGAPWVTEQVPATIAAGSVYQHNFATTFDFSTPGVFSFVVVVKNNATDPVTINDTAVYVVRNLQNNPLNLATAFKDDLESAAEVIYNRDTLGLSGIDRYDFLNSLPQGQLNTFLNSGIAYSGKRAFILGDDPRGAANSLNYVIGTYNLVNYDLNVQDIRMDFQFMFSQISNPANRFWVRGSDTQPWLEVFNINANRTNSFYRSTPSLEIGDTLRKYGQTLSSSFQVRWGQSSNQPSLFKSRIYAIDDVQLYTVTNDMQMLRIDTPGTVYCDMGPSVPLTVSVYNSHTNALTNIPVKYSINNGAWISETIPLIPANAGIQFTFSQRMDLSLPAEYTIRTIVDFPGDTYRKNDTVSLLIRHTSVIDQFPSLEDFEDGKSGWYTESSTGNNSWEFGTPASPKINKAASGSNAWKTRLAGNYLDDEFSFLYSPCYKIGTLNNPMLSFSMALDVEDCRPMICDFTSLEYSVDGKQWSPLGNNLSGTNWYNNTSQVWSRDNYTQWHVATTSLPAGLDEVRFRFRFFADAGVNREGVAIDDFHIYDSVYAIYNGNTPDDPVVQQTSGSNWIHFLEGGKLIASVQPDGSNLGVTSARVFIDNGPVRSTNAQYYHGRNITIQPAATPTDSVTVRFYFLDTEVEKLLAASGCLTCDKPESAYDLGISKYTDADPSRVNGTIADNTDGSWRFLPRGHVRIVPYLDGYYAEFRVKEFSEFWLNSGGFDRLTPMPVKLLDFIAEKRDQDVVLTWKTGGETDVLRYEIELALSTEAIQAGMTEMLGSVGSRGNTTSLQTYTFTDTEPGKFGLRYYRLKITEGNGKVSYSTWRSVLFDGIDTWRVMPNPSSGKFYLVFSLPVNEELKAGIYDVQGRLLRNLSRMGSGGTSKMLVDLTESAFPSGVYLLRVDDGSSLKSFKLFKQ